MVKDRTNVRKYHNVAVGRKFQTALGTPATPDKFLKEADWEPNPNIVRLDPQGTHGSRFKLKQGVRTLYKEPTLTVSYHLSRSTGHQVLEALMGGGVTSTGATGQCAITGSDITVPILTFFRFPDHIDAPSTSAMTVEVSANGGNWDIKVYKEAAKTTLMSQAINVVASAAFSTIPLAGYRLVLSGTLSGTPAGGDFTLTVKAGTFSWLDLPLDYFTLAIDDGIKMLRFSDCYTKSFTFSADGKTSIRVEEEVIAMNLDEIATALTADILDNEFLAVRDLSLIYDQATDNFSLPVEGGVQLQMMWETEAGPDNAANPEYFDRDEPNIMGTVNATPSDETQAIQERARDSEFRSMKWELSYGNFGMIFNFPDTLFDSDPLPRGSGKRFEKMTLGYEARADGTASPIDIMTATAQYHA